MKFERLWKKQHVSAKLEVEESIQVGQGHQVLWQKNIVTMGCTFFLKSSKRIKLKFQLNLSHSDMYSVLGWLLHFPIPLPVAVTTKQRTFCDLFLAGVSSQFAGSCWTWSRGCLWQHSVMTIWLNREVFSPLVENMCFFSRVTLYFKYQRLRSEATAHRIWGQMSIPGCFFN